METDATLAPAADAAGSAVFVGNAGLVLTSPFLPHLFHRLGVTTLGGDGRPRIADAQAPRAVNLLQYLATGSAAAPDAEPALNKVLCGMHPSVQLPAPAPLTTTEAETCDQLLAAMIANWPAIGSTSWRRCARRSCSGRGGWRSPRIDTGSGYSARLSTCWWTRCRGPSLSYSTDG
jgi:hypothetical protein